ncbi:E3 ubiquitin-protein ligase TRIM71-like [Patiria miniata]|uniref:B box-type domain-containing protein n=1 Tax=Patiria miniata TaxID=46514 RepID=A0A913ZTA4_PATMI|nr:E3 ubiquitin-protein ligase TRIM71-like [Patiria miniata]
MMVVVVPQASVTWRGWSDYRGTAGFRTPSPAVPPAHASRPVVPKPCAPVGCCKNAGFVWEWPVYKSKLREEVPKCDEHPDQNLNVYCNSCEQVICTTCSVLDHEKHSLTGLPEAVEKCKKKVTEMVQKSEKRKTELSTTIEEMSKSRKDLDTMFAYTQKKISKKAQQEITKLKQEVAKIKKEEQKLLKETSTIYKDKLKAFEAVQATNRKELTQTEHKLEEVNQLMNQASCYEILELQQKLLHNLSELSGKQPQQVPDRLTFMDFEEGDRSLGRLILEEEPKAAEKPTPRPPRSCVKEKWELKSEATNIGVTQTYISHVAALFNNKILGCGYPRGITFTSSGDLVVAAGESVQVYHRV